VIEAAAIWILDVRVGFKFYMLNLYSPFGQASPRFKRSELQLKFMRDHIPGRVQSTAGYQPTTIFRGAQRSARVQRTVAALTDFSESEILPVRN
jgi:hypothetical protein